MNADDYIRGIISFSCDILYLKIFLLLEIDFIKTGFQMEEDEKEFAEEDPDPMEEVIAQELERRAKKAEKERQEMAKKEAKKAKE